MILHKQLYEVLLAFGLVLIVQGCAASPQRMIDQNDHVGLAKYYSEEAEALNQKANDWRFLADLYDTQASKSPPKLGSFAFSCRQIANNYGRASQQAEELAALHRRLMLAR